VKKITEEYLDAHPSVEEDYSEGRISWFDVQMAALDWFSKNKIHFPVAF
jgi:hypothetical protein